MIWLQIKILDCFVAYAPRNDRIDSHCEPEFTEGVAIPKSSLENFIPVKQFNMKIHD